MKLKPLTLLSLMYASLLVGCSTPSHLIFHQSTSIGADAAANADTGTIHVSFGYNRDTNTIIPKTETFNEMNSLEPEAMSVVSASEVKVKFFIGNEVTEQFATGQAARNLAADPRAIAQLMTLTTPTN